MKATFIITFLLHTLLTNGQVQKTENIKYTTIGEAKLGGIPYASLEYRIDNKDTVYLLIFRNSEYEVLVEYEHVSFTEKGGTLKDLYQILAESFTHKRDEETSFSLGAENMIARVISTGKWIRVYRLSDGANFSISRKHLDKLFAKK